MYFDVHCHAYEYDKNELKKIKENEIFLVCVTEDIESIKKSLDMLSEFNNITVFAGIHPWNISNFNKEKLIEFEKILKENIEKIKGIGEIGLDKLKPNFNLQIKIFESQLRIAKEYKLPINVHCVAAYKECFELIEKYKIEKVNFHWFSKPQFIKDLNENQYFSSFNETLKIKENHKKCLELINENLILIESDGPYEYKNLKLHSLNIKQTYEIVRKIKNVSEQKILKNTKNYLKYG